MVAKKTNIEQQVPKQLDENICHKLIEQFEIEYDVIQFIEDCLNCYNKALLDLDNR